MIDFLAPPGYDGSIILQAIFAFFNHFKRFYFGAYLQKDVNSLSWQILQIFKFTFKFYTAEVFQAFFDVQLEIFVFITLVFTVMSEVMIFTFVNDQLDMILKLAYLLLSLQFVK